MPVAHTFKHTPRKGWRELKVEGRSNEEEFAMDAEI